MIHSLRLAFFLTPWMLREGLIEGIFGGAETDEELARWCGADDLYIYDEDGNIIREWHR